MALRRVKNARITAELIGFFGSFFLGIAGFYFGLKMNDYKRQNRSSGTSSDVTSFLEINRNDVLYGIKYGYPVLIGIWCNLTTFFGMKATKKRAPRKPCMIGAFFVFSFVLAGLQVFVLYNFTPYIKYTRAIIGTITCEILNNNSFWTNCYLRVVLLGGLLSFAVLILLLALWCAVCSCYSLCKGSSVEPEEESEDSEDPTPATVPGQPMPAPIPGQPIPATIPGQPMPANNIPMMPYSGAPMPTNHAFVGAPSTGLNPSYPTMLPPTVNPYPMQNINPPGK